MSAETKPTAGRASLVARRLRALARVPDRLRAFARDRRGVAALEFALLLPFMIALYVASNETSQALTVYRKVAHTGSTLGDLTSQASTLSTADMNNIMAASAAVMSPFTDTGLKIVVAAVEKKNNAYVVDWSIAKNTTTWTEGGSPPITMPSGLISDGEQIIVTQVQYTYTSAFSNFMKDIWGANTITLKDLSYFRPRVTTNIAKPS